MTHDILALLERRLGRLHARQRLGIEQDHEAQVFGQGIGFFHLENWYKSHFLIRNSLRLAGLYRRGQRNAEAVELKRNPIPSKNLPAAFDGFTILHLTDLHVDMCEGAMRRVIELTRDLTYDICVMTWDFRGKTFGPYEPALDGVARVREAWRGPVSGGPGDHA